MQVRAGVAAVLQICALFLLPTLAAGQANQGAVVSLSVINADTDQPIAGLNPLTDGAILNLALLPTRNLNLRANVTGPVRSVRFGLDANPTYRVDDVSPTRWPGIPTATTRGVDPAVGQHIVTADTMPSARTAALQDRTPAAVGAMWVDSREPCESTAMNEIGIEPETRGRFVTISP